MDRKSFHFSVGDSFTGPIGMCLRVEAETPEQAVTLANEQLAGARDYEFPSHTLTDGVEYCNIYFNPGGGLTLADIDEENDVQMFSHTEELARRAQFSIPAIKARFYSDDLRMDFNFDANRWFQDASDQEIIDLESIDWGNNEAADRIALFMESRDRAVEVGLEYVRLVDFGFEVEVDEDDAKQWIALHRPNLLKALE